MKGPPVIIIGAHRSGTSATAHALQLLGLQIGQRLDSHYEPRGLQSMHEDYLRSLSGSWHEPTAFLDSLNSAQGHEKCVEHLRKISEKKFMSILGYRNLRGWWLRSKINAGTPWGWKEPRTTLFAPCWIDIFPEARVVHVVRHPLAAAASIRERELQFGNETRSESLHDLQYCLKLALIYIEAGEAAAEHAKYFQRVRFEDLQTNPRNTLKQLATFCELRFSSEQLTRAARTIRPASSSAPPELSEKVYVDLVSKYPRAAKLGYDWPATSRMSAT